MNKAQVQSALRDVRKARVAWGAAQTEFNREHDRVMKRLLLEALRNFIPVGEVAMYSGLTVKRVRTLIREAGFDPHKGKTLLSDQAAKALHENAELMGVEPSEINLLSPLAYLPMGTELRTQLEERGTARVTELPDEQDLGFPETALLDPLRQMVTDLGKRGGALVRVAGENYVIRLCSFGYDPADPNDERFGIDIRDLALVLGLDLDPSL